MRKRFELQSWYLRKKNSFIDFFAYKSQTDIYLCLIITYLNWVFFSGIELIKEETLRERKKTEIRRGLPFNFRKESTCIAQVIMIS